MGTEPPASVELVRHLERGQLLEQREIAVQGGGFGARSGHRDEKNQPEPPSRAIARAGCQSIRATQAATNALEQRAADTQRPVRTSTRRGGRDLLEDGQSLDRHLLERALDVMPGKLVVHQYDPPRRLRVLRRGGVL